MIALFTPRLRLDPFARKDAEELLALFRDPEVARFLLDGERVPLEWVVEEIESSERRFEEGSGGLWAARERADSAEGSIIGFVGFRPFFDPPELQLLYGLRPSHWGRGLATEAASAAIEHARTALGHEEIRAATDEPNAASIRVLERLGFERWKIDAGGPHRTLFYKTGVDGPGDAPPTFPRRPAAPRR